MKCYIVGGAVRDTLLGLPVQDRDWVVVGATVADMLALNFRQVGRDFPVFLHPSTHEEYALARTERKTGQGYHGFVVHAAQDVTLAQDLARRDLTMNAIAQDEQGQLIDPYHGIRDIQNKVLRHVSPAFVEDPVRILRLARFAARFPDFSIAPETAALMKHMVASGEVNHLVPERIWQELQRGLRTGHPEYMWRVLSDCGALSIVLPELCPVWAHHQLTLSQAYQQAHTSQASDEERFAIMACWAQHDDIMSLSERLRVPKTHRDLAQLVAREYKTLLNFNQHTAAESWLTLIERCDAIRRPQRLLSAGNILQWTDHWSLREQLQALLTVIQHIDAGAIARSATNPAEIPSLLHQKRLSVINTWIQSA